MEENKTCSTGATNTSASCTNTSATCTTTKPTGCSKNVSKDFYDILGINEKSSHKDIDQAYKKLAAQWHPEKHPEDRVGAQQKFNQINEAYAVLSDPAQKHHYDIMKHKQFSMTDAERIFEKFFE